MATNNRACLSPGSAEPSVPELAHWVARTSPSDPPIYPAANIFGMHGKAKRKQLKRCVGRIFKTEYGTEAATAVEDETAALIEDTDRFLSGPAPAALPSSIADVDTPSPNDLGRVVVLFSFPDHDIPCEEKLARGDCRTSGCTNEHQSGAYFELLAFMTNATTTLDISMYILSCQFVFFVSSALD